MCWGIPVEQRGQFAGAGSPPCGCPPSTLLVRHSGSPLLAGSSAHSVSEFREPKPCFYLVSSSIFP